MLEKQWQIIHKFIFSCKSNICFLRVPDGLLTKELKNDFCVIDAAKDFSPYKPFLGILESLKANFADDKSDLTELSYSVQRNSFISYFLTGIADERYDIPLANELLYEQNRFIKTIICLLEKYSYKNYLILNAQCLSSESVAVIRALENSEVKGKFAFCYSAFKNDMEPSAAFNLLDEYSSKPNYLYLVSDILTIAKDRTQYKIILDMPEEIQFGMIYKTLRNNRIFMCLNQLKEAAQWVSENFMKFDYKDNQKRELSLELAKCLFDCNLVDESILYLNDLIDEQDEDEFTSTAYYYLARAFSAKKAISLINKYCALAKKCYEKDENNKYRALNAMLDFYYSKTTNSEDMVAKYQEALRLLEMQGYTNNYISLSVSVPWKLMNDVNARAAIDEGIDKCLSLADKIDNQHLVSTACHWKGIICSHYGEINEALEWYDKCNEIRTKIGEIGPLLNIRNGLCYDSMCRAVYKRAYDLENGIVENLYNISDFSTVTDTLKNLSYALFYSRHFSEAYEVFNLISKFLQIFNMDDFSNNSFLPTINDMLLFKSIIDFDMGDFIHARVNHANIMQNVETVTKEDLPFIYLIEAVLHADEKDLVSAEILFEKCIIAFKQIKSKMAHKIVFAYYEFAVCLHRMGYTNAAEKYMQLGFNVAVENGFEYFTKKSDRVISVQQYIDGVEQFEPLKIDLAHLDEKAEKEQLLNLLHKRIHDYQFINKLKTSYIENLNIKKYLQTVLMDIGEYTLADEIYFGAKDENGYKTYEFYSHRGEQTFTEEIWEKLFKSSRKSEIAQLVHKEKFNCFFGNISYADYTFGLIIIPSDKNPFTADVVNTINIALSSIQSQVVIYKQEEHLMIMSSTDQLSRLKNRHAFQECISLESERIRRYQQRKDTVIQMAVGFIDLDNFKYYNDTFGHNVGDLLIKSFSNLLRDTCRKIDFISRYGGDEFVIIMVDTNASEGERVYQRLNEKLESLNFFIPQIKALLKDENLEIPREKYLGFSMGISTNHDVPDCDNLDQVVQYADKALYYSKEHCKGSVTVWADIKDKV